jgi:hypothetical protein
MTNKSAYNLSIRVDREVLCKLASLYRNRSRAGIIRKILDDAVNTKGVCVEQHRETEWYVRVSGGGKIADLACRICGPIGNIGLKMEPTE